LIELLTVMIIIGILVEMMAPMYSGLRDRADKSAATSVVRSASPAIEAYYSDQGTFYGMNLTTLEAYDPNLHATNNLTIIPRISTAPSDATSPCVSAGSCSSFIACASSNGWWAEQAGPAQDIAIRSSKSTTTPSECS
jgi:Tfp pilus assembly protein PilE